MGAADYYPTGIAAEGHDGIRNDPLDQSVQGLKMSDNFAMVLYFP